MSMKIPKLTIPTLLGLLANVFICSAAPNATTSTNVLAESTVQYASGTIPTSFTNYASSYDKVKYSATQPAKSYLKFDFTGQNPNTNYELKFSFTTAAANQGQDMMLWALNQGYAGFTNLPGYPYANPSLNWSNAQANYTGTNEATFNTMMTSGTYTATLVNTFVNATAASQTVGVSVPAPWGQYLTNNQIVIVLTASNGPNFKANGARYALASTIATFQPLTTGTAPPTISAIAAQTVRSTQNSDAIAFTVSDPLDSAASLTNITISLGNTNVTLTSTNVSGSGTNRTLTFIPVSNLAPGATANVTVTLTLTDSSGNSATSSFLLTVPPYISLPIFLSGTNVNYIPPTNRVGAGSVTIPFQVVDTNITASTLVVTGAVPYSTNISSLSFTQSGGGAGVYTNNCTVTVTLSGSGVGIVNLQAIDPSNLVTNSVNLAVVMLPDSSYAFCDLMNYQPSAGWSASGRSKILDASGGLWATRGSGSGSVDLVLTPGAVGTWGGPYGVGWIRGSTSGNQNQVRLVGAPYAAGSHKVLYACINAQWEDLSLYGATAYYPGNSTGSFVEFAADATTTGVTMAGVCTITNSANTTNNDGSFYLGLYNGTNGAVVDTDVSLAIPNYNTSGVNPNSPVSIVVSYDVDTGISQMWLNQTASTGSSVNLQDVAVTNLANCSYLVLRQNGGMGNILINSTTVKVVTKPSPVVTITGVTYAAGTVTINYTSSFGAGQSGSQTVWSSSTVNGSYAQITSGVTITDLGGGSYRAAITGQTGATAFYKTGETPGAAPTVTFPF